MSNGIYWWIIFFDNLLLRIFAEVRVPVVRIIWSIDLSEFNLLNKGNIDKLSPILAAWNHITLPFFLSTSLVPYLSAIRVLSSLPFEILIRI